MNAVHFPFALLRLESMLTHQTLISLSGVRMFVQATTSLMVSCLEVGIALPDHILALSTELAKRTDVSDPAWRYYETMVMLTNFRAYVRCGDISNPPEILARAHEIDSAALSICANAPSLYEYETIHTNAEPSLIFVGRYHVYQNYMSATVWNGMRNIRMMVQEIIRDTLVKLHSSTLSSSAYEQYTAQYQASTDTLRQLQSDIIASVPQHLGYAPGSSTYGGASGHYFPWSNFNSHVVTSIKSPKSHSVGPPTIRAFGGYTLPWALYVAGAVDVATEPIQEWIIETLQTIGRSMGIQQAVVLADRLSKRNSGA